MDSNVRGNLKDLILKANETRKSIIRNLFAAITIEKGKGIVPDCPELKVVSHNPMDSGFSARDFSFFKSLYNKLREDAISRQSFAAETMQREMQKEGRYNPLVRGDRDRATMGAIRCSALISAIEAEETRRVNSYQEQRAKQEAQREKDRHEYEEYLAAQKAAREAAKAEVRAAEAVKREAAAQKPKLQGVVLGNDLSSLANLAVEMRKVGKFTAERKITKAQAIELAGNEITLKNIMEVGGGLLPDFRQIVTVKAGVVTRYMVKE